MAVGKLPANIVRIITEHNDTLIQACMDNLARLQGLAPSSHNEQTRGQMLYWKQCASGLKWSNHVARCRQARDENVN